MAYIDFKRDVIVVLNKYEATAFTDSCMTDRRVERYDEDTFDDVLEYGITSGWVTPLNDDQFKYWSIEPIGDINAYDVATLSSCNSDLFFVVCRYSDSNTECLKKMFSGTWLANRKYMLSYVWA